MRMRMLCLTIQIKRNDEFNRKHLNKLIIDYLMKHKILGATVWNGFDGFGRRRRSL